MEAKSQKYDGFIHDEEAVIDEDVAAAFRRKRIAQGGEESILEQDNDNTSTQEQE